MNSTNGVVTPLNRRQHPVEPTRIRYMRGGTSSPSGIESATSSSSGGGYRTPVKMMEEDVLVMDGVMAPGVRVSMSSSGEKSARKSFNCLVWDSFGQCRFGSTCQFVHGKEGLQPHLFSVKNKLEVNAGKTYSTGSSSYGPNYPLLPLVLMEAANQKGSPTRAPEYPCKSNSFPASPECSNKNSTPITTPEPLGRSPPVIIPGSYNKTPSTVVRPEESKTLVTTSEYWSPQDDGILVALPAQTDKCSSRKEVDACIENALYGSTTKKRLPVFTEFCPDN